MFDLFYALENVHNMVAIRHLFYHIADFSLLVAVDPDHVFAATQQLHVLELLEAVEVERTQRFA